MALRYQKLTPQGVKSIAPGFQIQENGIVAKRLINGDLHWSINTMVDGVRIHRVIGTESGGVTRHHAEQAIENLRTQAREDRLALPSGRKTYKSLAVASAEYMDRLRRENGKNLVAKAMHFRAHLVPKMGAIPINKITEERLTTYRRQRRAENVKDSTINRELATLKHFFNKASSRKWRWVSADDVPDFDFADEPQKPFKVLSIEELQKLRNAAAEEGEQALLFVEMMVGSAMRPDEVVRSELQHIVDGRDELLIPKAKAGFRVQPITRELAGFLRDIRDARIKETGVPNGWLFPSKNGKHLVSYDRIFKRCVVRAGLNPQEITAYTLKRTAITDVAETGVDLKTLMKFSGHKTVVSALRYIQPRDRELKKAMRALERRGKRATAKPHRPLH